MNKITVNELLAIIPDDETLRANDPIYSRYLGWEKLDAVDEVDLVYIGELDVPPGRFDESQYWGHDAPQDLSSYPYYGCDIYRYGARGGVYFRYEEMGGHVPEKRCRLVRRELIVV